MSEKAETEEEALVSEKEVKILLLKPLKP